MTYEGNCLDGEYDYDQVYDWRNKKWVDLDKNIEIKYTSYTCKKCGTYNPPLAHKIIHKRGNAVGHTKHTS